MYAQRSAAPGLESRNRCHASTAVCAVHLHRRGRWQQLRARGLDSSERLTSARVVESWAA